MTPEERFRSFNEVRRKILDEGEKGVSESNRPSVSLQILNLKRGSKIRS